MTDLHVILQNVIFLKGRNTVNCGLKAIVSVILIKGKPVLSCTSEMMKCVFGFIMTHFACKVIMVYFSVKNISVVFHITNNLFQRL